MIERILAIVTRDGQEAGRGESLIQRIGKGIANPRNIALAGMVLEWKYQDDAANGGGLIGLLLRQQRWCEDERGDEDQEETAKGRTE
jgi:hypothetical protein